MSADLRSAFREIRRLLAGRPALALPPQTSAWGWVRAALAFQPAGPPSPLLAGEPYRGPGADLPPPSAEEVGPVTDKVRSVVRDVVSEIAPEELVLLDASAALDDAQVARLLERRSREGFGMGDGVELTTPVVWLVVNEAAHQSVDAVTDSAVWRDMRSVARRLFRKRAAFVVPPLTLDQLDEVSRSVLLAAAQRGLSEQRARVIADAVVARLALGALEQGSGATAVADSEQVTGP